MGKTRVYFSVTTSTTVCSSVCANRKNKENKGKQKSLRRTKLLGAQNWQEKTSLEIAGKEAVFCSLVLLCPQKQDLA